MTPSTALMIVAAQLRAFCADKFVSVDVNPRTSLAMLQIDSLDLVELVASIEHRLGCSVDDEALESIGPDSTVAAVAAVFEEAMDG